MKSLLLILPRNLSFIMALIPAMLGKANPGLTIDQGKPVKSRRASLLQKEADLQVQDCLS